VIFLGYPERIPEETHTETGEFPAWRHQLLISSVVFALSLATFLALINGEAAVGEVSAASVTASLAFLAVGAPRFLEFRKISMELLDSGESAKSRKRGRSESIKAGLETAFFFAVVLGPFVLLFLAPPAIWFSSVLGMVLGLSASQSLFTLHIRRWETVHRLKLKRFAVWYYNEKNRKVVFKYGVRAEKA
jgi:hypothetical protein